MGLFKVQGSRFKVQNHLGRPVAAMRLPSAVPKRKRVPGVATLMVAGGDARPANESTVRQVAAGAYNLAPASIAAAPACSAATRYRVGATPHTGSTTRLIPREPMVAPRRSTA